MPEKLIKPGQGQEAEKSNTEGEFSIFEEIDGDAWKEGDAKSEISVANEKMEEAEKCRHCGLVSHGVDCPTLVVGYHGERKAALEDWRGGHSDAQSPTIKEPRRQRNKYYMMGWEKLKREQSENLLEKLDEEKLRKERVAIAAQIKVKLKSAVNDQIKEQKIAELADILKKTPKHLVNAKLQEFLNELGK